MPRLQLTFQLPEERNEADLALQAGALYAALHEVRQEIFRPARKHGYSDALLNAQLNNEEYGEAVVTVIGLLESKFNEILKEYNIGEFDV